MDNAKWGFAGKPIGIFEAYKEVRDSDMAEKGIEEVQQLMESAHTTSDFPTYLEDKLNKMFYKAYTEYRSRWQNYAATKDVSDFKEITHVGLSEFDDLEVVAEDADYKYDNIDEKPGPVVNTQTRGKLLKITRQTLINDDMGRLMETPSKMARAAARTLEKAVIDVLQSNPLAYDGVAMFDAGTHNNLLTGASSGLSEASLEEAMELMDKQTNQNGEPTDIEAKDLIVPTALHFTARRLLESAEVQHTATADSGKGKVNVVAGMLNLIKEKRLTDDDAWYVQGANDANETPGIIVSFLNGRENPDLMRMTNAQMLGSGRFDPYLMEVDELVWKVRHDWGVNPGEWRALVKSAGV